MKKENTINQEQEEMVFAEAPAQVIFNEKKEPDDIVEDDAEEIDEEDYEIEDDGDEEDDTPKNKFESCCVCHRTEEQGAKLIHMPTGLSICSDCMQKSFDSFNSGFGGGNGIQFLDLPAFSMQYHPEAKPGPNDSAYMFESFSRLMDGREDYLAIDVREGRRF